MLFERQKRAVMVHKARRKWAKHLYFRLICIIHLAFLGNKCNDLNIKFEHTLEISIDSMVQTLNIAAIQFAVKSYWLLLIQKLQFSFYSWLFCMIHPFEINLVHQLKWRVCHCKTMWIMHQHRQRNPFEFLPGDSKHTLRADMEFEMKCNLLKRCKN